MCIRDRGWTALHIAAANGKVASVQALLQFGASIDVQDGDGQTPLLLAKKFQHSLCVQLLEQPTNNSEFTAGAPVPSTPPRPTPESLPQSLEKSRADNSFEGSSSSIWRGRALAAEARVADLEQLVARQSAAIESLVTLHEVPDISQHLSLIHI